MKKNLLSLLLFIFCGWSVNAQMATMTPEVVEQIKTVDLTDANLIVKGYGELTNLFTEDIQFKWTINPVDVPMEWQYQLCDKNQCFGFGVLSNIDPNIGLNAPLLVEPNTISIMEMGVKPNGVAGCATFEIIAADKNNPDSILASATYIYQLNVNENCETATNTKDIDLNAIKVFPNPTTDYFTITDNDFVEDIQIFNIIGKEMITNSFQNGKAYNVMSFPTGLYLVRMMDKNGKIIKTTRLTKR